MTFRPETSNRTSAIARDFDRLRSSLSSSVPARFSTALSGTTSGGAILDAGSVTIGPFNQNGIIQVAIGAGVTQTTASDNFVLELFDGTNSLARSLFSNGTTLERLRQIVTNVPLDAGQTVTLSARLVRFLGGAGTATVVAAPASWFEAVWMPRR